MEQYISIAIYVVVVCGLIALILGINALIGPKPDNSQIKLEPFECGSDPIMSNDQPTAVKFYLIAILFILFDIEIVMLYPWAIVARELGMDVFISAILFIVILTIGLVWCWKKGALEWK